MVQGPARVVEGFHSQLSKWNRHHYRGQHLGITVHLREGPAKRCAHDTNRTKPEPSEHPSAWKWTDELQDDFVILGISHSRENT